MLEKKDFYKKIVTSTWGVTIILVLTFITMLILNIWTLKLTDDYIYALTFDDHTRFLHLNQLIGSMRSHYAYMNGRLILHSIVQILLIGPDITFDILNTVVFICFIAELYYVSWFTLVKRHNVIVLLFIVVAVWYFTPAFGHVFLWEDGSVNYLWAAFFTLTYSLPVVKFFWNREKTYPLWFKVIYCLLGFPVGALSESMSASVMGMMFFGFVASYFIQKRKNCKWMLSTFPFLLMGYYLMNISPGTKASKFDGKVGFISSFVTVTEKYFQVLGVLSCVWLILMVVYFVKKLDKTVCLYSLWLMIIALGMNYLHSFANRYPDRSMLGVTYFTIMAVTVLGADLVDREVWLGFLMPGLICLSLAIPTVVPAIRDVHGMYVQTKQNEEYIMEQKELGNLDIELPVISVTTKYAAAKSLRYLSKKDAGTWPNTHMAAYYGVNSIIGKNKK